MLLDFLNKEIHIWSVVPESVTDSRILENCLSTLSATELQHYQRFRSPEDSHCYLISHALVRYALSKYVNIHPSEWKFQNSPKGRPEISNSGVPEVCFNLTHTTGFCACIISRHGMCGIDAEKIDSRHNLLGVAQRMFSIEEYMNIQALEGPPQLDYFFSRWTLREAFGKAKGIGISFPTSKLFFEVQADDNIRITFDSDIRDYPANWRFELFRPTSEHLVAIALGGKQHEGKAILSRSFQFA